MSRRAAAVVAVVAALGLIAGLTGCSGEQGVPAPGAPRVDVDTPELRGLKAEAGIEPCRPGREGSDLPAVTLPCLGGGPAVDLSSLDCPLVLNFWSSACGPCREEMPALQRFHQQYGDRVGVVGVDFLDTYPGAALALARRTGATYPMLADTAGVLQTEPDVRVPGLPFFVLVDRDGRIAARVAGGMESEQEVVDLVEQHLDVRL